MQNKKVILIVVLFVAVGWFGFSRPNYGNYVFDYEIAESMAPKYDQQNMEKLAIRYANDFAFCKKVELGHHFFYYLVRIGDKLHIFGFEHDEEIGGSMIAPKRDDINIWVYNKHYVVFGQNPERKYSQYTLQITENGRVIKNITVDISQEEYILDAYLLDNYYNWQLSYN